MPAFYTEKEREVIKKKERKNEWGKITFECEWNLGKKRDRDGEI